MIIPVKHSALAMQSFLKDAVQGVAHQILGNNSATHYNSSAEHVTWEFLTLTSDDWINCGLDAEKASNWSSGTVWPEETPGWILTSVTVLWLRIVRKWKRGQTR